MKACAKPLIKYAGGKSWFVRRFGQRLNDYLDESGATYVDPFMGGGAVPLAIGPREMVLSDASPVAEMYATVADHPGAVAWQLSAIATGMGEDPGGLTEADYYRIRDWEPDTAVKRAARLIYLNRMGFNGVMRFNLKGKFNVPYAKDKYRQSIIERSSRDAIGSLFPNKEKFHDAARALSRASIAQHDFAPVVELAAALAEAGHSILLYLDPPYDGTYDGYAGRRFGDDRQVQLAAFATTAAMAGCAVIAHNADTPDVRRWWSAFTCIELQETWTVSAKAKGRKRAAALIFTNVPGVVS